MPLLAPLRWRTIAELFYDGGQQEAVIGMKRYDPGTAPDSNAWLALDEEERLTLVEDYHRRMRIRVPNARMHAVVHAVVETQIALGGETPARDTLHRLVNEGLDRHDAIHAIGSVLIGHISDLLSAPKSDADPNPRYFAELERLTAEGWRRS
jgi:hypothetical protein